MPRSPEDFAKETHERRVSSCKTCSHKVWKDIIHRVLLGWAKPNSGTPSWAALLSYLHDEHQYPLTEHALRNHVKNHERDAWHDVVKRHNLPSP